MIRCPKCSSLNRDSSRFCNECGAPLQKTRIRCPLCGTLNPVGNIFCDRCHARLLPAENMVPPEHEAKLAEETLPRVQGISLPTRSAPVGESADAGEKEEVPDWLMGLLEPGAADSEDAAAETGTRPDWRSAHAEEAVTRDATLAPAPGELPDWLAGFAPAPDALTTEEAARAAERAPEPALPDWMADLAAEAPLEEETAPASFAAAVEALPDWLSGLMDEEPVADAAPAATASAAPEPARELPDWLSDMMAETSAPLPAPEAASMAAPEAVSSADEFPDWLSGMMAEDLSPATPESLTRMAADAAAASEEAAAPEPDVLPDWLSGLMEAEAEVAVGKPVSTPAAPTQSPSDWLSAWDQDTRAVAGAADNDAQQEDYGDDDTWPEREALPPDSVSGAAAELEPAALPAWLRELGPRPDAAALEPLPEGLEQAEVPVWLEQFRPPGTAPLDASRAPETAPGESGAVGGLARAEIPDWVRQFRPSATAPAGVSSPLDLVAASPPESEGPLSGLAGLLPALPVVDAPAMSAPASSFTLPQSVVQEAQLWQHLLEREVSSAPAKPKARAPATWPVSLVRVVVAVVLALASVLSFSETPLAQPPEQPGIAPLYTAIEALQPGAEVLVAFEYGPAEVDEMSFIVEVLLEHLLSREVRIVALSTLPEGPGLIEERFAWAALRPDTPAANLVNAGFVPGGTAGVAGILASLDPETAPQLLLVVASRSERLKGWVEQNAAANSARLLAGKPALLLIAGVSAATGPQMRPYLDTPGVGGWLNGFPGAAAYWQARGFPPREDISRRLDALLLTQWAAASFLLAGALFYLVAGKQRTV